MTRLRFLPVYLVALCGSGSASLPIFAKAATASDSVLFTSVVRLLRNDATPLYIHPSPLAADPSIISVEPLPGVEWPLSAAAAEGPSGFVSDSAVQEPRFRVLRALGIGSRSIVDVVACGKKRFEARGRGAGSTTCMDGEVLRAAVIAVPRGGGPFVPGSVDERARAGPQAVSVRVIEVWLGPIGLTQSSADYVFELSSDNEWKFVRRRSLVIAG